MNDQEREAPESSGPAPAVSKLPAPPLVPKNTEPPDSSAAGLAADQSSPNLRVWPTRDLVTAFKGLLTERDARLPTKLAEELKHRPKGNIYPYTRGPDLANDGIGYGDTVRVTLMCPEGRYLVRSS